jgi:hypothetical protein
MERCTHSLRRTDVRWHKYPGWIIGIWIHVVEGVDPKAEVKLNAPERFETAFQGIPREKWRTFKYASEMMNAWL